MSERDRARSATKARAETRRVPSALVLVHGDFGDGLDAWGLFCRHVGQRYRTVVFDRPGFGEDIPATAYFTIPSDAAYILGALNEMGRDSFHLVGHSYGGLVALEVAAQSPQTVRSLHLIEPPLLDLKVEEPAVREMEREIRAIHSDHDELGNEATTERFFAMLGASHVSDRLRGTPDWQRLVGYADRFVRSQLAGSYSQTVLDRLPTGLPVGLYAGGRSHPVLRSIAYALAEAIPVAILTDVPSAGHAVQMSGQDFVEPLLALVEAADDAWELSCSVGADADRK